MHRLILSAAVFLSAASASPSALAADEWGIEGEKVVLVSGTVVDLVCEVAKECAPDCGGGKRQLGLLTGEGKLYPVVKGDVLFANAVDDLKAYCGKTVEIDGLLIESPRMTLLFAQYLKAPGGGELAKTGAFQTEWTARNPALEGDGEWFRADPLVKEAVAENGVLGIPGLVPAQ